MLRNRAIRAAAVTTCLTVFGGAAGSAQAATKGQVLNPFTLTSVPVASTVTLVTPPVFVPVDAVPASPNGNPVKGPRTTLTPGSPPPAQISPGGSPPPPPPPTF